MKPPDREGRNWKRKLNMATAGLVLGGVGLIVGTNNLKNDAVAAARQESCRALSATLEKMTPDKISRQSLCTNELIRSCLERSNFCPEEE